MNDRATTDENVPRLTGIAIRRTECGRLKLVLDFSTVERLDDDILATIHAAMGDAARANIALAFANVNQNLLRVFCGGFRHDGDDLPTGVNE